jgi:hypothetical protein
MRDGRARRPKDDTVANDIDDEPIDEPIDGEMIPATELARLWSATAAADRRRAMDALAQVAAGAIGEAESGAGWTDALCLLREYVALLVAEPDQLGRLLDDPVADVRVATATALEEVAETIVYGLLRTPELYPSSRGRAPRCCA